MGTTISRRQLIQSALASGTAAGLAAALPIDHRFSRLDSFAAAAPLGVEFDPAPFTIGVSSGDPLPDSVILWTRLATDPLNGGGMADREVPVHWTVARDPGLRSVVAQGMVLATEAFGHSVHVDVRGLEPGSEYFYAFEALGVTSRVGRTRTAPEGPTSLVRFGFASCQNFPAGRYAAHRGLAGERLDFVVFLGDYMYEGSGSGNGRAHVGPQTTTLEHYRNRYALYQGDPALRASRASCPWIVTWDDHEVDNNYAGLVPENRNAAEGNATLESFSARRAAAYQAYYEHMPIRLTEAGMPSGPDFRIHRQLRFGDLLDLSVLDTRQHRDDQVTPEIPAATSDVDREDRSILGPEQRTWLQQQLTTSATAWRALANQLQVHTIRLAGTPEPVASLLRANGSPLATTVALNGDAWDGYQHDRRVLLDTFAEVPDCVVITGDIHTHWVADLDEDVNDPTSRTVATEFVGTSITSSGFPDGTNAAIRGALLASNPHIRFYEGEQHGYAIVELTPDVWRTEYRVVADLDDPNARISTLAAFEVDRGTAGARQVGGVVLPRP
ncbi:MAG: alkaline phosphatase D family protein [Actinomycetes bacterium]